MPFYQRIQGSSGGAADVDSDGQLLAKLNADPAKAGAVRLYDSAGAPIIVEENGALSVSQDNLIFNETVDGNAVNTNRWTYAVSGMTVAQANSFITLNNASAVTANAYAILQSILQIPFYGVLPTEVEISAKVTVQPQANFTIELGFGNLATTAAPTDGCFFRWTPSGTFVAVVNNAGAETISAPLTAPTSDVLTLFSFVFAEDAVQFKIGDVTVAELETPPALGYPVNVGHLPIIFRTLNASSAPGAAPKLAIGAVTAVQLSLNQVRPFIHVLSDLGFAGYQSPVPPFAQTANRGASSAAASLALSNTVPSLTTLGGEWQFAALAAAVTDYALFAYQVPSPYKLRAYGVHIWAAVLGAAIVTPTILDWVLGINCSAASLATAESPPTTWAPKRIPVGHHAFLALAGIGAQSPDVYRRFEVPMVVDAGRYLHIILRVPNGANTANLLFRGGVFVDAQHE